MGAKSTNRAGRRRLGFGDRRRAGRWERFDEFRRDRIDRAEIARTARKNEEMRICQFESSREA